MEQIRPKKNFGQNFLIDNNILNKIVKIAEIEPNSLVIEIGIGTGNLTEQLIKEKITLLGYEIDNSLKEGLDKKFNNYSNLNVVYDDFLKRNLKEDLKPYENKQFRIKLNATYSGNYKVPSVHCGAMYNNNFKAHTEGFETEVTKR